jgi:hypothetical protein
MMITTEGSRHLLTRLKRLLAVCLAIVTILGSYRVGRLVALSRRISVPTSGATVHKARTRAPVTTIDVQSGIEIVPRIQSNMFPEDWVDPTSPTSATAPVPELVPYAVEGIKRALRKYPTAFLKKNLKRIYVVNNLLVDGQPSGGVNAPEMKTIYVDLDNLDSSEVTAWSEETIHHEFAHLLADNHPGNISMKSWAMLNRPGFTYGNGGTDAIRIGKDGDDITPEYLSQGFVEEYSKSAPDEDFATLCERMFSGDRNVLRAAVKYPLLRKKAHRVVAFYHSLDQSFTDGYFKKLQPSRK